MATKKIIKNRILKVGDVEILYDIHVSDRKTITLVIDSIDAKPIIKMPLGTTIDYATNYIEKNIDWVVKTVKKCRDQIERRERDQIEKYSDGSTYLFLGKPYTLKIVTCDISEYGVYIEGENLVVKIDNTEYVDEFLNIWNFNSSNEHIRPMFIDLSVEFGNRHKIMPTSLKFKNVKSYWGLCTSSNEIRINSELVRAPKECIEYIIVHELCHLVHKNHSKYFYALLDKEMPDWRERKERLNRLVSVR